MTEKPDPNLPRTLVAQEKRNHAGRPRVFDPALAHFSRAFQLGDYVSPSAHERLEWERLRAEVRAHLLEIVANSRWHEHLVLRGSALMQAWFGEQARDPKDLDWVFRPADVGLEDPMCQQCFSELQALVARNPRTQNTEILAEQAAWDDIWTYERAAGRRLIFPFQAASGAGREIQMDIVWNEPLLQEPMLTSMPHRNGATEIWAATPELSLAWKLLWLANDMHAQGKDLYDAVLLAERAIAQGAPLEFGLLRAIFDTDDWWQKRQLTLAHFDDVQTDWQNFQLEYPFITGTGAEWEARLMKALAPTFDASW